MAQTTEAEGRRERTHRGVLPSLAGERGGGAMICTVIGGPYSLPMMYRTACPGKDLLSCKLLAIPAAAAVDY